MGLDNPQLSLSMSRPSWPFRVFGFTGVWPQLGAYCNAAPCRRPSFDLRVRSDRCKRDFTPISRFLHPLFSFERSAFLPTFTVILFLFRWADGLTVSRSPSLTRSLPLVLFGFSSPPQP